MHHVIPQSVGGTFVVPLCSPCHGKAHGVRRSNISELTKLGLQRAKARGVTLGATLAENRKTALAARQKQADGFAKSLATLIGIYEKDGLSQRQMVSELNTLGIPATRGGQWSLIQLQRVLARLAPAQSQA
jgi:hypothetical protein